VQGDPEGEVVADLTERAAERSGPGVGALNKVGLGGQCRPDGPDLRAGRLAVAVHPHEPGDDSAAVDSLATV
jgi:hypothetical protein